MPNIITVGLRRSTRVVALQECLDTFSRPDEISGWHCSGCNEDVDGEKSQLLTATAPYLFVNIDRIAMDGKKNTTKVEFPRESVNVEVAGAQRQYEAVAVIEHSGVRGKKTSTEAGHWSCCRLLDGKWWWCSDEDVEKLASDKDFQGHSQASIVLLKEVMEN